MDTRTRILAQVVETVTVLHNEAGSGKTLTAVALAYQLREAFGRHVICDIELKEPFGEYTFMDSYDFLEELSKITTLVEKGRMERSVAGHLTTELAVQMGIDLVGATIVWDEAYKNLESRRPHDPLTIAFAHFVSQIRHYRATLLLTVPHPDMIEKRVRRQVRWYASCSFDETTKFATVRFRPRDVDRPFFKLKVYGPRYWDMYDSWAIYGFRRKILDRARV